MTSLNGNFINQAPQMSSLLQKHLQQSVALNAQNPVYIPDSKAVSSWYTPNADVQGKKTNKSKKAKIAAFSLASTVVIAAVSVLGILKTGKNGKGIVKKAASRVSRAIENKLNTMYQNNKNGKAGDVLKKFYIFREEANGYANCIENVVNGKDVLMRSFIDKISGKDIDVKNAGFLKGTYKKVADRVIGVYHKFDNATTNLYKRKGLEKLNSLYEAALGSNEKFDNDVLEALNKLKKTDKIKETIEFNDAQVKVEDIISAIEKKIADKQAHIKKSFSKEKVTERVNSFDNFLTKGESGISLTEKTTRGFVEKIKEKEYKSLLTEPVARGIIKDEKAIRSANIRAMKDAITNNLNTAIEANRDILTGIRKSIDPNDIDSIGKYDEAVRLVDKYKRTVFKTQDAALDAREKIFAKVDDLIKSLQAGGAKNSTIKPLDDFKNSLDNIKPGETEEIMDALSKILDTETYANVIEPGCKRAQKALHKACSMEMNDTMDKLRDINCGSAPTDFLTVILSSFLTLLYTAQADNNDERVSIGLTTGLPLLSTVATNLYGAINQFSGKKSMIFSLGAGFVTKKICDKLDKAYKKSRGLDENAKPSIATIDDYISYLDPSKNMVGNKFAAVFGYNADKNNAPNK